ncbi:MAG: RHS repeat-associated core domain-containing protein [Proteobacteria bacterium]|nr:RHS repeat-associated core domain-containing protein [Pseudomonadota bacterium]
MFYRARYYDPKIGRFISEDPIGFEGDDLNLYRYVFNSSLNMIDPSGESMLTPNELMAIAVLTSFFSTLVITQDVCKAGIAALVPFFAPAYLATLQLSTLGMAFLRVASHVAYGTTVAGGTYFLAIPVFCSK